MKKLPTVKKFVEEAVKAYIKTGLNPVDDCFREDCQSSSDRRGGCLLTALYEAETGDTEGGSGEILSWAEKKFGPAHTGMMYGFDGECKKVLVESESPRRIPKLLLGFKYGRAVRKFLFGGQ